VSDLREPLHQPPNPEDLRRVPPANPTCARVRGLLRDFVDGDLARDLCVEVEEHAHRCRVCAVELSRAEHERLIVCRAFAALARGERPLAPGFSARVVQRLVLDETSLESGSR
jgi:anti-sigma factor RsiW